MLSEGQIEFVTQKLLYYHATYAIRDVTALFKALLAYV